MSYKITGYSTALFSTWFFIEELGLLFDVGDGVMSNLLQKSGKIRHVFISHADRDHINGLPQLYQLNARANYPKIYYPKGSGSFPALQEFLRKFDPHLTGTEWIPIQEEMLLDIKGNIKIESIRNGHILVDKNVSKSLSYKVVEVRRKIKEEFAGLSGKEIAVISKEKGKEYLTKEVKETLLGYSGDTPVENYTRWDNTKTLIHESTFLSKEDGLMNHSNKHSNLEEVLEMVSSIKIERLILSHFSSRYSKEEIDKSILKNCQKYNIDIPVYRMLPGVVHKNILAEEPVNKNWLQQHA